MAEIGTIVVQMADALKAAHAANIVHGDLKPSNLMLTTTGQLKVLDFGLAKIETGEKATQLTRAGSTVGTAAYMSPKQSAGEVVDAQSDLWSLGVVTYEMLAGWSAFEGTNALAIIHAGPDDHSCAGQNGTARRSPGVGRGRQSDAGARDPRPAAGWLGHLRRLAWSTRICARLCQEVCRCPTSRR